MSMGVCVWGGEFHSRASEPWRRDDSNGFDYWRNFLLESNSRALKVAIVL